MIRNTINSKILMVWLAFVTVLVLSGKDSFAVGDPDVLVENASIGELKSISRESLDSMREVLSTVMEIRQRARESRDVVKLNCVNQKLIWVKGLLRVSEQSYITMQEGLAKRNMSIARHEFGKIMMARRRCTELAAESETCVGEFAVYTGDTKLNIEINRNAVGDGVFAMGDTLETLLNLPDLKIVTFPAASPYQ